MTRVHSTFRHLLALYALAVAATAQAAIWTTVGSAGTVDDDDLAIVDLAAGEVRAGVDAPVGSTTNVRYNIVSLNGFSGNQQVAWLVRYRDNGPDARVRLSLKQYNTSGTTSSLSVFDSNDYAPAVGYQTRTECIAVNWDFDHGPFFIEAELIKSGPAGGPALGIISMNPVNCTP